MTPIILLAQDAGVVEMASGGPQSVAAIIAVAGAFLVAIVFIICVTTAIQRVFAIRSSNKLIMELVNKGFTAEEIERIVYGNTKFGTKVGRFFRDARCAFRKDGAIKQNPVPPVKAAS